MRARVPATVIALALAVTSLAGCRTNVGVAARVDGHTISEGTVDSYVLPAGITAANAAQLAQNGEPAAPKALVVATLVQRELYRQGLAAHGGIPSSGILSTYRAKALTLTDAQTRSGLVMRGVRGSFAPILIETRELSVAIEDGSTSTRAAILKQVAKAKVSVSPRYGSWDNKQSALNPTGGLPAYLTLQSDAASANQPG